jgi:hypothetical protein
MRLINLKEEIGPSEISMSMKKAKKAPEMPKTPQIGKSGAEASAFQHKTHAGSVTKIIPDVGKDGVNPQVIFTQIAMGQEGNPFFPRFYKAKIVPHGQKMALFVEMEKLQPITGEKIKHMIPHILKQIGISKIDLKRIIKSGFGDESHGDFSYVMNDWSKLKLMSRKSKNPEFKKAIDALAPWVSQFNLDLHEQNWMFRLTGTGPQLVILDPFYKVKKVDNAFDVDVNQAQARDAEYGWVQYGKKQDKNPSLADLARGK